MNKIIVAVFDTETGAYKGVDALKALHNKGDISLYSSAVLVKDASGKVEVKQSADEGPVDTAFGLLIGSMIGLLAGPAGVAAGASIGSMTGMLFDLGRAGVSLDFIDEVSAVLIPGKSAVLAEVDEEWVTPVNTTLNQFGALIVRRSKSEVIEDQLNREAAAFSSELKQMQAELKKSDDKTKAAMQKTAKAIAEKLKSISHKAKEELDRVNLNTKEKINSLQAQMKNAHDTRKAQIKARIEQIKADQKVRSAKLEKARKLASEALTP
jgi:uncharacterized membrane protein